MAREDGAKKDQINGVKIDEPFPSEVDLFGRPWLF